MFFKSQEIILLQRENDQKIFFIILLGIRGKHSAYPLSETFSPHLKCHHHRDLTFTSTELRDLKLRGPFSLVAPNFINALGQKFPNCYPLPYFSKYFPNFRQGATEIDFNTFQFGKHSFQFSVRNWNYE